VVPAGVRRLARVVIAVLVCGATAAGAVPQRPHEPALVHAVHWDALPAAVHSWLTRAGIDQARFPGWLTANRARTARRIREGDEDHLVAFALQSRSFTPLDRIEPALSAKAFVSGATIPADAAARLRAMARTLAAADDDPRLAYFRELPHDEAALQGMYTRAMRVLHDKEFVAGNDAQAVAAMYQQRGLSTDSAVEAGYAVQAGLATLHALDPARRIRRVAIIGPGLEIAPRTGFVDGVPPQSPQPFAVADALISLGLADRETLQLFCLDVNPRVVTHLARIRLPVDLMLVSSIAETGAVRFTEDYRRYVLGLGLAIGDPQPEPLLGEAARGRLRRAVRVRQDLAGRLHSLRLDVVTERADVSFDLVVVTNVLPYLANEELALALANMRAMLAEDGVLLHNEARPILSELAPAAGLPLRQGRTVTIATVAGSPPLYDTVWLHGAGRAVTRVAVGDASVPAERR